MTRNEWIIIFIIIIILIVAIIIGFVLFFNQSTTNGNGNGNGNDNGNGTRTGSDWVIIKGKNDSNDSFTTSGDMSYYVNPEQDGLILTISAPSKSATSSGLIYVTNLSTTRNYAVSFVDYTLSYNLTSTSDVFINRSTTLPLAYKNNEIQILLN